MHLPFGCGTNERRKVLVMRVGHGVVIFNGACVMHHVQRPLETGQVGKGC